MKDVYVIENHQDDYRFVYSWLETVDSTPPQTLFTRPVNRLKINKVHRQDSTRRCNRYEILTPSHSSLSDSSSSVLSYGHVKSPVASIQHRNSKVVNPEVMPGSSRKRTRPASEMHSGSAYSDDEEGVYEQTPKASRQGDGLRGWRRDDRSRSGRSTPSLASSSAASGASSPTKQFRYAEKQETGFQPLNFEPNIHRLPPSLKRLRRSLNSISFGEAILPLELREEVEELGDFPQFAFFDSQTQSTKWRIPPTALVRQAVTRAVECDQNREGESSWNMDVHRLLLDFAFREADNDDLVDYRYCTGAQIVTEYKPKGAPSKMVDFCICIKPQDSSTEARVIESFTGERPGLSINHTDWGNFCKHPIALSIETKRQSDWDKALLQMGTWHSAQWRSLQFNNKVKSIDCLPGIVVQGHSWHFVASTLEDGRSKLYNKLDIGGTDSHFAAYKLLMALQCLGSWIEQTYWPAFKVDILGQASSQS